MYMYTYIHVYIYIYIYIYVVDGAPVSGLMQSPVGRQKGLLRRVGLLGPPFFSLAATLE